MRTARLMRWRRPIAAATALLAGCGGAPSPIGTTGAAPQYSAVAMRAAHGKSWMAPDAKKHDLLYVADGRDKGVYVLTYPQGKVVGMLTTGLANPVGVCTDKLGNVWIANYDTGTMVEYAHGGSEPISSVQDPGTSPLDCSVDPTTGNLAVVAGPSMGSQTGSFLVYDRAAGTPHTYSVPFAETSHCGYDDRGNLFVDGFGYNEVPRFAFGELRRGESKFRRISIQFVGDPGPVRWDGKYIAIGDKESDWINRYAIRGRSAVQAGTLTLNAVHWIAGFWIRGDRVVVTSAYGMGSYPPLQYYKYPAGGSPISTTDLNGADGVAVSVAPK